MNLDWNELKHNHLFMMVLCCAIPLLLLGALYALGADVKGYSWLAVLLCPLAMVWMMKDMHGGKEENCRSGGKEPAAAPADAK